MVKDFSEFAKILSARTDYFEEQALQLVDKVSDDGVTNMHKLVAYLPGFNLRTCVEVLELYHKWLHEPNA